MLGIASTAYSARSTSVSVEFLHPVCGYLASQILWSPAALLTVVLILCSRGAIVRRCLLARSVRSSLKIVAVPFVDVFVISKGPSALRESLWRLSRFSFSFYLNESTQRRKTESPIFCALRGREYTCAQMILQHVSLSANAVECGEQASRLSTSWDVLQCLRKIGQRCPLVCSPEGSVLGTTSDREPSFCS